MGASKEWQLKYICRECYYRRSLEHAGINRYYYGNSRGASFCAYFLIEGEQRGCTPSEGECARFKPRIKWGSLHGRHETIK